MRWPFFARTGSLQAGASRITVRERMSWPLRVVLLFLLGATAAAAGVAIYEFGRNIGGPGRRELMTEVERLGTALREVTAERDRNAAQIVVLEGEARVQKAAQDQLVQQVGALETEQTRLKGDLSFFESLLPTSRGEKGVVVRSFRLEPTGEPGQYHYRLLVQQAGKPDHDFAGAVQLRVAFNQNGRGFTLQVPAPDAGAEVLAALQLSFRHYQRIEGNLTLPAGSSPRSVLVSILAGGEARLQQTFPVGP
jgi:hypothetical protein